MTVRIHWLNLLAALALLLALSAALASVQGEPVLQIRYTGHVGLWL